MKYFIGGIGEKFCRRVFALPREAVKLTIRVTADPQRYSCESWQPLRNDGNDGKWLMGGSFVKFRLMLDGREVGMGPLRQIDDANRVEHTFLLNFIPAGKHVFAMMIRGEANGVALEWQAEYADGSQETFDSSSGFRELDATPVYRPICWEMAHIYNYFKGDPGPGEYFEHIDGTKLPVNWHTVDFDDRNWADCQVRPLDCPIEKAAFNYQHEALKPVKIEKLAEGHFLIDFGREAIGGIALTGAEAGGVVEVRLGEELLNPRMVRFQMRTGNCYQERWHFLPGGQQLTHFGLRIFRYAEVVGYAGELTRDKIEHRSIRAPFDDGAARFETDNVKLKELWEFCKYTIKATNLDLYNDCFSRERIAYEADSYITMLTNFAVEGDPLVAKRTLEYMINHHTWPCEWFQMMIPLFYEYYQHTGDLDLIGRYFDRLIAQSSFATLFDGRNVVKNFPYEIIIDWPVNKQDGYVIDDQGCTVPNALMYYNFRLLEKMAVALGRSADELRFGEFARQMYAAINRELFEPEMGLYCDSKATCHASLHANMWALWCNVVPQDKVAGVLDYVEGKGMSCSLYSAQFLLDVLFRYGRTDSALKLLLSSDSQSWFAMLQNGASITTEVWLSDNKPNMSWAHPWGSSPANLIVRHIWGLYPLDPGWKRYEAKPLTHVLGHASLKLTTPGGVIEVNSVPAVSQVTHSEAPAVRFG